MRYTEKRFFWEEGEWDLDMKEGRGLGVCGLFFGGRDGLDRLFALGPSAPWPLGPLNPGNLEPLSACDPDSFSSR